MKDTEHWSGSFILKFRKRVARPGCNAHEKNRAGTNCATASSNQDTCTQLNQVHSFVCVQVRTGRWWLGDDFCKDSGATIERILIARPSNCFQHVFAFAISSEDGEHKILRWNTSESENIGCALPLLSVQIRRTVYFTSAAGCNAKSGCTLYVFTFVLTQKSNL